MQVEINGALAKHSTSDSKWSRGNRGKWRRWTPTTTTTTDPGALRAPVTSSTTTSTTGATTTTSTTAAPTTTTSTTAAPTTTTSTTAAPTTTTSTTTTTTAPPPTTTTTSTTVRTGSGVWQAAPGTTWQWQLTGNVDLSVDAQMYDIDLYDNSASVVNQLHQQGRVAVCYFSAGSWEDWRPDAGAFPAEVKGKSNGWPGEKWLDIRRLDILGPIMEARLDLCVQKGFDGIEPDNIDGYTNNTGFPLSAADQLAYNKFLANAAHARGLSIGLKNDVDQARALEPWFDFAINEECATYNECGTLSPFIAAGKAVFHVEYSGTLNGFCPTTTALGFSSMKKRLDLDAWRQPCP